MDIRFADHPSFHRAALGMTAGALLSALALYWLTPMAPLAGGILGIALGAAFAHRKPIWRLVAAAGALVPLFAMAPTWAMLAAVAAVVSLGIAVGGPRGARGLIGVLLGAITVLVGMWCALKIGHAKQTATWPALVTTLTAATAMGLVGVLAMLPRHIEVGFDPVRAAVRKLPLSIDGEVKSLCERAVAIWISSKPRLDDAGKRLVSDGVVKTLEVAGKSADVKPTGPSEEELGNRMRDLDQRIAAATDSEVKTQYQAARSALTDQQRYRDHIKQNRERLVARMHNHVAALEKFQLAATGLEAARAASAGATAVKQLEELSHDVTASGEALAEIELTA